MRPWEKVMLPDCENAKCICPGCEHGNDHRQMHDLEGPHLQSCCGRHSKADGVVEDEEDICGIAKCPDYEEAQNGR